METITNIQKQSLHSALGWLLKTTLSNGNQYNIYCEWFWELNPNWNGDVDLLIGMEVSNEWCKNYNKI